MTLVLKTLLDREHDIYVTFFGETLLSSSLSHVMPLILTCVFILSLVLKKAAQSWQSGSLLRK